MQQLRICLLLYETKYIYLAQTNKYNTCYLNEYRSLRKRVTSQTVTSQLMVNARQFAKWHVCEVTGYHLNSLRELSISIVLKNQFYQIWFIFSYREILTGLPRVLERVPILNIWIVICVVRVLSTKVCATLQNCLMFVIVVQFNVMQDRWLSDMR